MFIVWQTAPELIIVALALVALTLISWRRLDLGVIFVLLLLPSYLIKIYVKGLPFTVLELLILALVLVWFAKEVKEKSILAKARLLGLAGFWLPILLILVGAIISTVFSADFRTSAGIFKAWFLEPVIFGLILFDAIKKKKQFINICLALVVSGTAVAAISLVYWVLGDLTFDGRLRAFYQSPNHLAMFLAPCLILGVGLWSEIKESWRKFLLAGLSLMSGVIYLAGSYAAWLAIFVSFFIFSFVWWRLKKISGQKTFIIWGILASLILCFVFLQMDSTKWNNMFSSRSSWQSRLAIWQTSVKIISDHWLLGIGPGLFQKYYLAYQKYFPPYLEWAAPQPHNLFLAFWLQAGLLGLVGFLWLVINFFKSLLNLDVKKLPLALMLMAVMIYILAHGVLDTTYWKNDLSLIFWAVIFLSYRVVRLRD